MSQTCTKELQLLSLDGGGLRGMFAASALAAWERDFDTRVANHFDLIVGTSTGGLLALGLAFGKSPAEMLDIYLRHADKIFPQQRFDKARGWRRAKYRQAGLRGVLEDVFGSAILGDAAVRLAIPTYDLAVDDVHLMRTPHHIDLRRDWRHPVVEVALATTAAPGYLPAVNLASHRLVDGGTWANNPVLVGVAECFDRLDGQRNHIRVLSVGTTSEVQRRHRSLDRGGIIQWVRHGRDLVLRGYSAAATNHAGLIVGRDNLIRFDAPVPDGLHGLDAVDPADLVGRAEAASRHLSPRLTPLFEHVPAAYEPCHSKETAHALS